MNTCQLGIYIHVPYCVRKCRYCDFVSGPLKGRESGVAPYFDELCADIEKAGVLYGDSFKVDTVFFGGGTPSIVEASHICNTLKALKDAFVFTDDAEISLEANPGTITREKLAAYRASGFNRLSMGVQSLDDKVLSIMGRIHDSAEAISSYRLALEYFDNINIDLMMGVPGQDPAIWKDTLSRALELEPSHLSFYSLQLEEGTPFYKDYRNGLIELPSWEENRSMYHLALDMLKAAGYHHYEVSNAAKPGFECRHNIKYWSMKPYLGFGSAAHSFIGGRRFEDGAFPGLSEEDAKKAGELSRSFAQLDKKAKKDLEGDYVFTGLRLTDGLDESRFYELFGESFEAVFKAELEALKKEGLLTRNNNKTAFTSAGLDLTNPVIERLLELL